MGQQHSNSDFLPANRRDLLARLLWNLSRRGWKGTVHLASGERHWSITLSGTRIRGIDLWDGEDLKLGRLLTRDGTALASETDRAAELARHQRRLAGQVLTDQGLPGALLDDALKRQARLRFDRFLNRAHGWVRLEPGAILPVRASLGRPMDLAQALMHWARPNEPMPGPRQDRTWYVNQEAQGRAGRDLAGLLPPGLEPLAWRILATGRISWQKIQREIHAAPTLGTSFLESLWTWLALLERLGLAVSAPRAPAFGPAQGSRTPSAGTSDFDRGADRGVSHNTKGQEWARKKTARQAPPRTNASTGRSRPIDSLATPPVPENGDLETLRRWWHRMARRYHPDSNPDADPEAFHRAHEQYLAALAKRNELA